MECTGISIKHLGENLDIHCGGIDNAFPHHTNEIAQSEAYLGHKWCNYWVHILHLNINSGKMSKSKGEFLTVSLLIEKGYRPVAYRFFCLQSHYRKSLIFSWENLDNAAGAYNKLLSRIAALKDNGEPVDEAALAMLKSGFAEAMDNDLNTSLAITSLYDALKFDTNDATKLAALADFDRVLSLDLIENAKKITSENEAEAEIDPRIDALIAERATAKKLRDFSTADRIRDDLKIEGIELIDTPQGTIWKKST